MDPFFIGILVFIVATEVLLFGGLWFLAAYSKANRPSEVNQGKIPDITGKPNCVSSVSSDPAREVEPIPYSGDDAEAWGKMVALVREIPKTTVVTNEAPYLYAEMQTRIFGFVDDFEIKQDRDANLFHVRSASRVGYSDMDANRKRMENLRRRFSGQ